ncbi:hypothetical protein BG011_004603 [Mortierella polycephala]|uniref:Ras-GEF domain-containing protein n=1 Tax=Mortierella polycephala TaxID=41804 RepID=A0A9P6U253_9FUNG|nr:hypothetical protein BG011_004603 [Mortierella polycephala]
MDMTKYASLIQSAKADQDRGDLKSAYSTYIRAHATIIQILGTQVTFNGQDQLESAPNNSEKLIQHAQEILRRLQDILAKSSAPSSFSKTGPSASSATKLTGSSTSTTVSVLSSPSPAVRPTLKSYPSSQRSLTTTATQINARKKKNIPMIPLSPLTRQSLMHTYALSQVTQRLEQAKHGSNSQGSSSQAGNRDLANLRRLIEDVRIQRAKVDAVQAQIQSVANFNLTSWDPDVIARQLTIIDSSLFKQVAIPQDLVRLDRKNSRAQYCSDFENYVTHSFAHLLLLEWSASRQASPVSSSHATTATGSQAPPINAIAHMIRVAHILLHVYRNFNSFRAVMRALTKPEIKRMHKPWSSISSKVKDTFRRLVVIYREQNELDGYNDALVQRLDAFQDVGKDAMVAIPWMRYHQDEVKSIIQSYLSGHESTGGSSNIVLSAPGARKLSAVTALLMQCRTNESGSFEHQNGDNKRSSATPSKHREPVQVDGLKTPLTPVWDLVSLGAGNATLYHWLLSRPFLNNQQLIDESLEIEPLFNGEELPCYETSLDNEGSESSASMAEDLAQDESFEHVIAPEHDLEPLPTSSLSVPQYQPPRSRTPVSEAEINDIMNELLNDDDSGSGGLFDDDDDPDLGEDVEISKSNQDAHGSGDSSGRNRDVLQFLGINPGDYSDAESGDDNGGDFAQPTLTSTMDKGKGRALVDIDNDEIDSLMARAKGLVHESRSHLEELEFNDQSETEMPVDQTDKTAEPLKQDIDEDEFGLNVERQGKSDTDADTTPSASLSLEALRRQFQAFDQEPISAADVEDAIVDNESGVMANVPSLSHSHKEETISDSHQEDGIERFISNEPADSTSADKSNQEASTIVSDSTSINDAAPISNRNTTPIVISKARVRKVPKDRTVHVEDIAGSFEDGRNLENIKTGAEDENNHAATAVAAAIPSGGLDEPAAMVSMQDLDKLTGLFQGIKVNFTLTIDDSSDDSGDEFKCSSQRFRREAVQARSKLDGEHK